MIKVSVIMPVYNMADYLEHTIKSVQEQTLKEIELICIDDGSTDISFQILKKFECLCENVLVIQQQNRGSGVARNQGILKAKGEYICFLDADDFYASDDALEYLYNTAKKKKVVVCGGSSCDLIDGVLSTIGVRKERQFKEEQYIHAEDYPGVAGYWGFIFERQFILKNNIFFPEYLRGQDACFFINAIAHAGKVFCVSKTIYVYRKEHKKVLFNIDKALGLVKSFRDLLKMSNEYNMRYVQYVAYNELCGEVGALAYKFAYEGSEEMQQLCAEINSYVNIKLLEAATSKKLRFDKKILLVENELDEYVLNNCELKEKLIFELKRKKVYIYGAGTIGKKVKTFLVNNNVDITAFLVSDIKQNVKKIDEIPVWEINDLEINEEDYSILIATFWYTQSEIIELLKAKDLNNVYPIDLRRFYLWNDRIEH